MINFRKAKKNLWNISRKMFRKKRIKMIKASLLVVSLLVLVGSIISAVFFYRKYRQNLAPPQTFTEIEAVVRKVSVLMELPQGETPTLATVSDKTKLQDQTFFQNAENGDRILVYTQAQKAVLYRPSTNKIIDIAPIFPLKDAEDAALKTTPTPVLLTKVAFYNGSGVAYLTNLAEEKLKQDEEIGNQIEVVIKENAQSQYQGVLVVDVAGNQTTLCQSIARLFSGKIVPLPENEKTPAAQILVILGKQ
jgi:cytoskeletal protein RodZ